MDQKERELLWKKILAVIETEVSKANFLTLFKNTAILSLENNIATIAAPSTMIIDLIKKRFSALLKSAFEKNLHTKIDIILIPKTIPSPTAPEKDGPLFVSEILDTVSNTKSVESTVFNLQRVRPDYTFQTLAVSSSNQLAYVAATTVAKNLGKSYNPLFIYGPSGVGKTHLMQAIANDVFQKYPDKKILYETSEEFTNEVVEAIRNNQTQAMKKKFRSAFLFIIDDVQFIAGKDRVQEELFHTFNILIDNGAQIVLSSDRPPQEIKKLEKRLSSRFLGGLTVDIEPPDFELRCAIVLIKAKKHGYDFPIEIAKTIASDVEDTRYLEGALLRIITEATTKGEEITKSFVEKTMKGKSNGEESRFHRPDEIIKNVCDFYHIKVTQIKGEKRDAFLVKARQICMYLLKKEVRLTYAEIGHLLGGRDHTTVMYGVVKIETLIVDKPDFSEEIKGITDSIKSS